MMIPFRLKFVCAIVLIFRALWKPVRANRRRSAELAPPGGPAGLALRLQCLPARQRLHQLFLDFGKTRLHLSHLPRHAAIHRRIAESGRNLPLFLLQRAHSGRKFREFPALFVAEFGLARHSSRARPGLRPPLFAPARRSTCGAACAARPRTRWSASPRCRETRGRGSPETGCPYSPAADLPATPASRCPDRWSVRRARAHSPAG